MTDPELAPEQKTPADDDTPREPVEPAPFWRKPAFAVIAAVIALIGTVWRCA